MTDEHALAADIIERVKRTGFLVYIRPNEDGRPLTYLTYTDGNNIAYMQWDRWGLISLSSVYRPSRQHGTGARFGDIGSGPEGVSAAALREAFGHVVLRHSGEARPAFFDNMQEYLSYDDWNAKLVQA